ncbi:MAG: FAD-dependent oxidoreductase, partial [Xanthobacteraceae bacterium]
MDVRRISPEISHRFLGCIKLVPICAPNTIDDNIVSVIVGCFGHFSAPEGISGADLAERAREQASRFGTEILIHRAGVRGEFSTCKGVVYLDDGTKVISRVSVCATGVEYRRLGLPNEEKLFGAGVYYGAGASEAQLCGNEHVVIVGAGNSSAQASLYLAHYARKVSIVMHGERLNDNVSEYLVDRVTHTPNIEIVPKSMVVALHGDDMLQAVTLR